MPGSSLARVRWGRWLEPEHPDPAGRNMRELWLPALEWFFSERVYMVCGGGGKFDRDVGKPNDTNGKELSDEAVLALADFAIFIECACTHTHTAHRTPRPTSTH